MSYLLPKRFHKERRGITRTAWRAEHRRLRLRAQFPYPVNLPAYLTEADIDLIDPVEPVDPKKFLRCNHCRYRFATRPTGLVDLKDVAQHKRTCRIPDTPWTKPRARQTSGIAPTDSVTMIVTTGMETTQ